MHLTTVFQMSRLKRISSTKFRSTLLADYASLVPEQRLWRCVLIGTALDCIDYVTGQHFSPGSTFEDLHDAFTMVFEQTRDFELQADFSGIDPEIARSAILDELIGSRSFAAILNIYQKDIDRLPSANLLFRYLEQLEINYDENPSD